MFSEKQLQTAIYHALFEKINIGKSIIAKELGISEEDIEITGEVPEQNIVIHEGDNTYSFRIKGGLNETN